ncbi:MAG: acyltransferase [Treponema sp.]|nr:acyltransferase [Treponema sp.]
MEPTFEIPEIPKENAFNAIRFLLCLIVLLMHSFGVVKIHNAYLLDGHIAVCGFFILSGFWVTKSYFSSDSLKTFFIKRAKKILPMYYISVVGFSFICSYFSDLPAKEYFGLNYFKYIFWNSIFLNFVCTTLPGCFNGEAVNGALWTIKLEIGFYLILPVIMHIWMKLKTNKNKNTFLAVLYILSVTYSILLKKYAVSLHIPQQLEHQLPGFISFFISGMFIFLNWKFFLKIKNWLLLPSVAIYILHYITKTEILFPIGLAVIIVWLALTLKKLQPIGKNIDFSWGMYLFHFPLMQIIYYSANGNVNIPVYIFSVIGISFMFTFIIEKYIQKKIK